MERLPEEVCDIIYSYIPITTLYNLNHSHIEKYYPYMIQNKKVDKLFDSYLRYIIRNGCALFLQQIFKVKIQDFNKLTNWKYNNKTFPTYTEYLRCYTIALSKTNCRNIIEYYISTEAVSRKKRHKKIRRRNIKWSN